MYPLRLLATATLLVSSAMVMAACSSGGGSGSSGPVGSAAVMVTDASQADLEEVSITIDSITLNGTDASDNPISYTITDLDPSLNLRQLVTTSQLVDLVQGIPAGSYNEIAIHITKVVVDDADDNQPAATLTVDKTITLALDGDPIVVSDGTTTTITVDFDLALSLLWDDATHRWSWDTQAFVHHGDDDGHKEVDEVHGTIASPADLVCDPAPDSLNLTLVTVETGREIPLVVNGDTEIENQMAASDAESLDVAGLCTLLGGLADGATLRVEVQGAFADGVLTATKLEIHDPNEVEMKGMITELTDATTGEPIVLPSSVTAQLDCSATYGSMTVRDRFDAENTFLFQTGHLVAFRNADTCAALLDAMTAHALVKVSGTRQADDSILLDRVVFENVADQQERERHDQRNRAVHGTTASSPDANHVVVVQTATGDVTVQLSDQGKIVHTRQSNAHHRATMADIAAGACLELSGEVQDDGTVDAKHVVILPDMACH